jgi:hypothetical protein
VANAFAALAGCALLDPDNSVLGCELQVFDVLRAANSTLLDEYCARPSVAITSTGINPALLIVPVAILAVILILVLIVSVSGAPKTAT